MPALQVDAPQPAGEADQVAQVPRLPADAEVACLLTSGSTGQPQPHAKRWGALLRNIGASKHSEEEVLVAGLPGRQVYAEGRTGTREVLLKARFVVAGSRLYQIAYVGERDSLATADIDMFLTSFKLLR